MLRFFGLIFSNLSIAGIFSIAGIGALVHLYGQTLPSHDELEDYQPPMLSRVYNGEGRLIAEFARERRLFVPIDEVPPLVQNAFISAEDKNYWTHPGIDAVGIAKAFVRFAQARASGRSARLSGASTITQQVMKNFLVGDERSFERKIKEAILAVRLDGALSKEHILELYLNEIYLGAGAYGIGAAADRYFDKSLEELAPEEAAYLAALPKKPSELHPVRDRAEAVDRRNYVLGQMAENGFLDRAEAERLMALPLVTVLEDPRPEDTIAGGYFPDEVRRQMVAELGSERLYEGGLTIRATVDPDLQALAAQALRRGLEAYDRERGGIWRGPVARIEAPGADWAGRLAAVDVAEDIAGWHRAVVLEVGADAAKIGVLGPEGPATAALGLRTEGWITGIRRDGTETGKPRRAGDLWQAGDVVFVSNDAKGGGWRMRQVPKVQGAFMAMDPHSGRVLAIQGGFSHDLSVFNRATQAERQPGSAFKPFVYAAALDAGYTPQTVVIDMPVTIRLGGQTWRPKNSSGRFYGPQPLRSGIEQSRNLMTVRIAQSIGMDRVAEYAERFGVYEQMPQVLSASLGAGETTLWKMVAAYGMIANGGKRVTPTVVDRIQDRHGNTLYRHDPRWCRGCAADTFSLGAVPELYDTRSQIMNPGTAAQLVSMMEGVIQRGTAASTVGGLGFPVAGKTGTTNESIDAWFVGFTPNMVAGCWIGFDAPQPMGRGAYGGTLCGPVFREFMAEAMKTRKPGSFRIERQADLVTVKIDRETGERLPDDAQGPNVLVEVFQAGTEPEIAARSDAILDDQALFGIYGGNLGYEVEGQEDALPYDIEPGADAGYPAPAPVPSQGGDFGTSAGAWAPRRPGPPQPPADIGFGTGGLY